MVFKVIRKTVRFLVSITETKGMVWNLLYLIVLTDILRQRTSDIEVKRYCVKLLEKFGSFQYTRNILLDIDKEVRAEVAKLGDNPLMISLIDELLSWDSMEMNS